MVHIYTPIVIIWHLEMRLNEA